MKVDRSKDHRAKVEDPDWQYKGYGFADVRRACHRWLWKHDPTYRRSSEAAAAMGATTQANRKSRA